MTKLTELSNFDKINRIMDQYAVGSYDVDHWYATAQVVITTQYELQQELKDRLKDAITAPWGVRFNVKGRG